MFSLIQIQTTSKCSGNCAICAYSTSWHKQNPGYMNDDDFELVLQRIKDFDSDFDGQMCLYLMQDPLSDPKIIERTERAFQVFPKCSVEVSTNAMLLTPELSEGLIETILKYDKTDRSHFWISHHAINKKTYEQLMRRKNYIKTLNNIVEYFLINNGRVPTRLRGAGASIDGGLVYFNGEDYQKYWQQIFSENKLNPKNVKVEYFQFHNRAGNVKLDSWSYGKQFIRPIDIYHPFDCWRYRTGLHMLYNLDIVPCCMCYQKEVVWGNLEEQSLKAIWKGKTRQEFIDKATGLIESDNNFICKRCISPGG